VETSSRKEFGFVVEIDGSYYLISARSAKDQCEWVKAIRECIAFLPTLNEPDKNYSSDDYEINYEGTNATRKETTRNITKKVTGTLFTLRKRP